MAERIGEGVDLELETDFDDIERRNDETRGTWMVISSSLILEGNR